MASVIQFVDSIAASPTVRLDLNSASSNLMISDSGIDLSPPPFREAVASTLLQDGDQIAAGAFGNRTLKLPLKLVYAASTDAAATAIQNLARELNRPRNILKVQVHGATSPVFFRTFRAPSFVLGMLRLLLTANTEITLEIPAEPFAYGLLETPVSGVTVSADPAAGSNGGFVDVIGVKGDVESPALISFPASVGISNIVSLFASRRRGTPSATPFYFQAESMTQGTDTTTQANSASFSGAGNNYSRVTFATVASMATRLSMSDLGTPSVDLRGTYRVFLRYRKNTATDDINVYLAWGGSSFNPIENDPVTLPDSIGIRIADLGLVTVPQGPDPVYDFLSGVELVVDDDFQLLVLAERTAGTGTLDLDYLWLVPADDRMGMVSWLTSAFASVFWLDAYDNSVHGRNASGQVASIRTPSVIGGFPMLTPNQANRIYILHQVGSGADHAITATASVSLSYYPRYLTVRPAST
jgi:hypothetical protein